MPQSPYVRWFGDIRLDDVALVGGKTASLGELYSTLSAHDIRVPNGFAITARAYYDALTAADAWGTLHGLLDRLEKTDVERLKTCAAKARRIVYEATGRRDLRDEAAIAYRQLEKQYGDGVAVAARSSATAEDLPNASFAGQHESQCSRRARSV
jgi:pyruvate, water dikinase